MSVKREVDMVSVIGWPYEAYKDDEGEIIFSNTASVSIMLERDSIEMNLDEAQEVLEALQEAIKVARGEAPAFEDGQGLFE